MSLETLHNSGNGAFGSKHQSFVTDFVGSFKTSYKKTKALWKSYIWYADLAASRQQFVLFLVSCCHLCWLSLAGNLAHYWNILQWCVAVVNTPLATFLFLELLSEVDDTSCLPKGRWFLLWYTPSYANFVLARNLSYPLLWSCNFWPYGERPIGWCRLDPFTARKRWTPADCKSQRPSWAPAYAGAHDGLCLLLYPWTSVPWMKFFGVEFEMIARDLCGCEGLGLLRFSSTVEKTSTFFLDLPSSAGCLEHCQLGQLLLIFAWSAGIPHWCFTAAHFFLISRFQYVVSPASFLGHKLCSLVSYSAGFFLGSLFIFCT